MKMTSKEFLPKYPIYIISKGRWMYNYTAKALDKMGVPYHLVIEPHQFDKYAESIDPNKILTLPFSNHGKGSGPARNWCWEHSKAAGHKRHWIMDDNIRDFWRYHFNKRVRCVSGAIFKAMEDFTDRFTNVMLSGPQYTFFYPDKCYKPPYCFNTRLMSCILINNDCRHRWRGKYNEDVDLSLRILKDGDCTIIFNAFLQGKLATQTIKGGNTEELYGSGTFEKSKMLVKMHPDCVRLVHRYGRWHHHVDIMRFKDNEPKLRDDFVLPDDYDEYGMKLVKNYGSENQTVIDRLETGADKWKIKKRR